MSENEDLGFELPPPARASRLGVGIVAVVLVGGAFAFGYLRHRSAQGDVPQPPAVAVPPVPALPAPPELPSLPQTPGTPQVPLPGGIK